MIWEIFRHHKLRILLTYLVFLFEFVLFAFLPYFLGKGVDSLLAGKYAAFWLFVGLGISGELIGFFRRRLDTRVFVGVWTGTVSRSICGMIDRDLKTELIINRSHLTRHYSDFFEYTMPSGFSSLINIVISCYMIVTAANHAVIVIGTITLAMSVCYYVSCRIQESELKIQDSREVVGNAIGARNKREIVSGYDLMKKKLIHRSNLDATAWLSTGSLSLISQVAVVLLVVKAGHSLGTIMSCLAYTTRIFERIDIIGTLLNQWKQVGIADQLLEAD